MLKVINNNYDTPNSLQKSAYAPNSFSRKSASQLNLMPSSAHKLSASSIASSPPQSHSNYHHNYSSHTNQPITNRHEYDYDLNNQIRRANPRQHPLHSNTNYAHSNYNTLSSSRSTDGLHELGSSRYEMLLSTQNNKHINQTSSLTSTSKPILKQLNTNSKLNNDNYSVASSNRENFDSDSFVRHQNRQPTSNNLGVYHQRISDQDVLTENKLSLEKHKYDTSHNQLDAPSISSSSKVNRNYLLQMKRKYKNKISANVSGTKFDIVRQAIEAIGCKIVPEDNFDCNLIWDDTKVSVEGISELKSFQRYNHFPAMSEISKKDALARNMLKIYKLMPHDFDFVPKTWVMPNEYSSLLSYAYDMKKMQQKKTFILKPSNGAMGHGIKLFKNVEKITPADNYIVQEYIPNPYLLDGFKFDLRIYALVTSCDPLRAFIYNNGLVRLGTEEYQEPNESNIDHLYMHLTNYSVNKKNKQFYDEGDTNGETGTKRSLKYLFEHLRRNNKDTSKVWKNIQDIILKTLLVAEPYLFHTYKMCRPGQIPGTESVCFEILGFDILIDEKMKPWVIEVNRCPSFGTNQQIDFDIKSKLLINSLELLNLRASDRLRNQTIEKAEAKRRLYNINSFSSRLDMSNLNTADASIPRSLLVSLSSNNSNSSNMLTKRFKTKERRKVELIDQIKLFRREQRRQEIENRNLGNYSRLFPIDDKYDMDYYLNILSTAFNLFYPIGKQYQWKKTYERIKEDKLLNELVECDDSIYDQTNYEHAKKLNDYLKDDYLSTESEEDSKNDESEDEMENNYENDMRRHRGHHDAHSDHHERHNHYHIDENFQRKVSMNSLLDNEAIKANRVSTLITAISSHQALPNRTINVNGENIQAQSLNSLKSGNQRLKTASLASDQSINKTSASLMRQLKQHQSKQSSATLNDKSKTENEDNANLASLTTAVLKLLNQLEIKFPGKSNYQTKQVLNKIYSKLDVYKPKIANYWMVKLDQDKRTKILNIVKSNLIVILQKVFMLESVENLRLYKIFTKLLNRMLWMHGQGLWNCFISQSNSSWETIFNKSTFEISDTEFKCCQRVIELCKDSVLIVYQYAFEQKPTLKPAVNNSANPISDHMNTPIASTTPVSYDLNHTRGSYQSLSRLKTMSQATFKSKIK